MKDVELIQKLIRLEIKRDKRIDELNKSLLRAKMNKTDMERAKEYFDRNNGEQPPISRFNMNPEFMYYWDPEIYDMVCKAIIRFEKELEVLLQNEP